MEKELSKAYDPKLTEQTIYNLWIKSGYFNPDKLPSRHKKPYTIALPPPNVTGSMHMGHALQDVIMDILIRWHRMKGYKALWIPGTDHAGIATQNKVEKELKKEGKTRHDIGREEFLKRVWAWKEKYGDIILDQLKRIGASCDWSRARFTMDKEYTRAVEEAFAHYHKRGWIYRALRVVNWCVRCGTSLSDLELEYREEKGKLWHINYPLKNSGEDDKNQEYITVATTRPETMLGDAAVAVNPKDERYKRFVGKTAILPIQNREIPIISDRTVAQSFGTGAVKVTPFHSMADWEIAQRHKLPGYAIINERGRMTSEAGPICDGKKTEECRHLVLEELVKKGLLVKETELTHQVPHCYRCESTIEPLANLQWFIKMEELAKKALAPVKSGEIRFIPKRWERTYSAWLHNIRDWNISRQIWWGHRLPVWFCQNQTEIPDSKFLVSATRPKTCPFCNKCEMKQSEDVLDTWFSSALWPFATLGWPQKTNALKKFYPTQTLCTARDIINLWVARMVFSGYEFINKKPFSDVYIHATVLTKEGKRMSKSLGTGIDPLELIEKYGADATRFGLAYQAMGTQDIHFSEDHIAMGKKFCNKIWNAARYVLMQNPEAISTEQGIGVMKRNAKTAADKKIFAQLEKTAALVEKNLREYRFGGAAHALYNFFWHQFADVYIEESKKQIQKAKTRSEAERTKKNLLGVLLQTLKLLHPFVPFLTEELYQHLPLKKKTRLLVEYWPTP